MAVIIEKEEKELWYTARVDKSSSDDKGNNENGNDNIPGHNRVILHGSYNKSKEQESLK